jgi:hypothetical protein
MRYLKLISCIFLLLSGVSLAEKEYVPDYFPAPVGAEWHYKLTSTAGMSMDIKTVISEHADASKVGYNIVQKNYMPQESINYFHKTDGVVYSCKTEMPASNYSADFVEDKPDLQYYTGLAKGHTWKYAGKMGGQDWTQDWTVVGPEKVTVPAGTFDAIKVESSSTVAGSTTEYVIWYVDRIGSVKVVTKASGMTNDMVLVKYSFPK